MEGTEDLGESQLNSKFDRLLDDGIQCVPMHHQPTVSIFTRKMNATDAYLPTATGETREFFLAIIILTIMAAAAILYVFHGIGESPDPCWLVMNRLDVLVRYWPLLILMTILYVVYQVLEFIALHTCCKPQQPIIITRPLTSFHKVP